MMYKKGTAKRRYLPLLFLSLTFYGIMLFLTLTAKDIHNARLPQVTANRLNKQSFTYTVTQEDGYTYEASKNREGIPKDVVDSGQIFIVTTITKEDMTYYYAKRTTVTIDTTLNNDTYYALDSSVSLRDMVILTGYEELEDGDEVYIVKEDKN